MVLKELCALRGVSGNEKAVRDFIIEKVSPLCDSIKVDRMGNVLAFKRGTDVKEPRRHVMLCAHMDEVGMIIYGINDNGLLSYRTVGGIDPRVVVSKRVRVGDKGVYGVIGAKALHLQSRAEYETVLQHDRLYIDIGASDKASAEALVSLGDYVSFESDWVEFGQNMVKCRALDDRVGCATMIRMLETSHPVDVTCAFTVQEETGLRGARVAAFQVRPDCAIVLEGTTANDLGDVDDHLRVCAPGKGVALSFMDNASIGHRGLVGALRRVAVEANIPWQVKSFVSGGNDAGAIQTRYGALPCAVLSVPCRNIHSPASVCSLADAQAQGALVQAFLDGGAQFEALDGGEIK